MYKVFIDNTPLHILQNLPKVDSNAVIIYCEDTKAIREAVFAWTDKVKTYDPVYLITTNPESTFAKLFEGFDFIEASGGIVRREDRFLFIKRNGFWDIPKGKLDKGEYPEAGGIREIEEECGIIGPTIDHLITVTYHTYKLKGSPKIKRTYWYALNFDGPKELTAQAEEGITKVKWFKLSELFRVRDKTFASILDVMDKYFEKNGIQLED
jgi:8-oxo-dGTP pyrophosphatase MutT (NUDIX family)